MTIETVAGAILYVSSSLPQTETAANYALLLWIPVGEVTDLPSVLGRAYNTSTHAPIASARQTEKKGSYKLPAAEVTCGWDESDQGQILIAVGADSATAVYAFCVKKASGARRYFQAQMTDFVENFGSVDNVIQGKFKLLRQTDTIKA